MDIRGLSTALPGLQEAASPSPGGDTGFRGVMDRLVQSVTGPQLEADQMVQGLAMGTNDQLHQVLLSVAKADLAFRLMLEVRNRLTEAYQEIQRMQI